MTFDPKTIRKGDAVTLTVIAAEDTDQNGYTLLKNAVDGERLYRLDARLFEVGTYLDVTVKRAPGLSRRGIR